MPDPQPRDEIRESLTTPQLVESHNIDTGFAAAIVKYQQAGQSVFLPFIFDPPISSAAYESKRRPWEVSTLHDEIKFKLVHKLLTDPRPLVTVVNYFFNHGQTEIDSASTLLTPDKIQYFLALVGPSKQQKSTLVATLSTLGMPVANLDARDNLAAYKPQVEASLPHPLTESTLVPSLDPANHSVDALQLLLDNLSAIKHQPKMPTLVDTPGYSDKKPRDLNPRGLVASNAIECLMFRDIINRSMSEIEQFLLLNPGMAHYFQRTHVGNFLDTGTSHQTAQRLKTKIEQEEVQYRHHAWQTRIFFALSMAEGIVNPTLHYQSQSLITETTFSQLDYSTTK